MLEWCLAMIMVAKIAIAYARFMLLPPRSKTSFSIMQNKGVNNMVIIAAREDILNTAKTINQHRLANKNKCKLSPNNAPAKQRNKQTKPLYGKYALYAP